MANCYNSQEIAPILRFNPDMMSERAIVSSREFMDLQAEMTLHDSALAKRTAIVATHAIFAHTAVVEIADRATRVMPNEEYRINRIIDEADDKLCEIIRGIGR